MWLVHLARMSKDRRAKQVMNWAPGEGREGKTKEKLTRDHLRRPVRIDCDVEGCFSRSRGQGWMEKIRCLMCSSGLRSKVRQKFMSTCAD